MSILHDTRRPVKTTRRPFGEGILRSLPATREPYTAADLAWLVEDNARREAEDAMLDRWAAESAAVDCHERGLIAPDVAGYIAATSPCGPLTGPGRGGPQSPPPPKGRPAEVRNS